MKVRGWKKRICSLIMVLVMLCATMNLPTNVVGGEEGTAATEEVSVEADASEMNADGTETDDSEADAEYPESEPLDMDGSGNSLNSEEDGDNDAGTSADSQDEEEEANAPVLAASLEEEEENAGVSAASLEVEEIEAGGAYITSYVDSSIKNEYNVPVIYYDYLDNNELANGWKNIMAYGGTAANGWTVFSGFDGALASYYNANNLTTTGLYFGNLLSSLNASQFGVDTAGSTRAGEVANLIPLLTNIFSNYSYPANNSNYLTTEKSGSDSDYMISAQGLVYNQLDSDGNLQIANGVEAPWFSESFLSDTTGIYTAAAASVSGASIVNSLGKILSSRFPFDTEVENGITYYEFSSFNAEDNIRYDSSTSTFYYGEGTENGVKDNVSDIWGTDTNSSTGGYGFFPFNSSDDVLLDYGFGVEMEIEFNLPTGGTMTDSNGNDQDVIFEFTGDDDVWVFIDGQLVLDMGGGHKMASGTINFNTFEVTISTGTYSVNSDSSMNAVSLATALSVSNSSEIDPTETHTMKIFYMERGMIESNLKIRFNMPPVTNTLEVEKEVDVTNVNTGLRDAVESADSFDITLSASEKDSYLQVEAANKSYTLSSSSSTSSGMTDDNGTLSLSDGQTAIFYSQFDDYLDGTIYAMEDNTSGRSYLKYTTSWKAVDLQNEVSSGVYKVINNSTGVDASFTYAHTGANVSQYTPVISLLTYTNTPVVGAFSVTKAAVDEFGNTYTDTETKFTYTVEVDMGLQEEIKTDTTDSTAVFYYNENGWSTVYAYCWTTDSNNNTTQNAVWPGVAMTLVDGTTDIYTISGVIGSYENIIFNNGSGTQTADLTVASDSNYYTSSGAASGTYYKTYETTYEPIGYQTYDLTYTVYDSGGNKVDTGTVTNGEFTLKAGQTAVFDGIPTNAKVRITESTATGYTLQSVTGATEESTGSGTYIATVTSESSASPTKVTFTNEKSKASVNIFAAKKIDGGTTSLTVNQFSFVLTGTSSNASSVNERVSNDVDGKITFPTLSYTAAGTYTYTISEVIPTGDRTYVYDQSVYTVTVVVEDDGNGGYTVSTTIVKTTDVSGNAIAAADQTEITWAGNETNSSVTFDNTTNTASLTVQKLLVDELTGATLTESAWPGTGNATEATFQFVLEKEESGNTYTACADVPYTVVSSSGGSSSTGTTGSGGGFTVTVPKGSTLASSTITFDGLIIGDTYRISEVLEDGSYKFYSVTVNLNEYKEGASGVTVTGNTGGSGTATSYAADVTIASGTNTVVVKNYPLSSITIQKEDEDGNPISGVTFQLEKVIDAGTAGDYSDATWDTANAVTQTTGTDGSAEFTQLSAGTYRITEVSTPAGYTLLAKPIIVTLPYAYTAGSVVNGQTVTSAGTTYHVTYTITNGQTLELPSSGVAGIGNYLAVGMFLLVMSGGLMLYRRRRHA